MAENESKVKLPAPLWKVMEPQLRAQVEHYDSSVREVMRKHGTPVCLRLNGGLEKLVHVNWQGEIYAEEYRGMGHRGDASGPPLFSADDIESWGYSESIRQPTLCNPFHKVKRWKVLAWADGRFGNSP